MFVELLCYTAHEVLLSSSSVTVLLSVLKALLSLPPPPLEIQDNGTHSSSQFIVFEAGGVELSKASDQSV